MAILTASGRTALAVAVAAQPLHFAWGSGDPDWDDAPVGAPTDATALVAELGRVAPAATGYCLPDEQGEILVPTGSYRASVTPTNYLYLRFDFNYADAVGAVVREAALFMSSVIASGLPAGQRYFLPADVVSPGIMLAVERFPGFPRTAQVRPVFEYVLEL